MDKIFILLGPPGCGKGTQTTKLAAKLHVPHIDTGSLLRGHINNKTEYGKEAKLYIDKGQLVPTKIVQDIIKTRLLEDDAKDGFILDGFPRSIDQAKSLEVILKELKEDKELLALYFDIPTDTLIERLVNRRYCPVCGMIYNVVTAPPKIENHCDICEAKLAQRTDDNRETALKRFETYYSETSPLLEYYKNKGVLKEIDADKSIQEVWQQVKEIALKEED